MVLDLGRRCRNLSSETPVPNINDTTMDKISERLTFALDGTSLPARALL